MIQRSMTNSKNISRIPLLTIQKFESQTNLINYFPKHYNNDRPIIESTQSITSILLQNFCQVVVEHSMNILSIV